MKVIVIDQYHGKWWPAEIKPRPVGPEPAWSTVMPYRDDILKLIDPMDLPVIDRLFGEIPINVELVDKQGVIYWQVRDEVTLNGNGPGSKYPGARPDSRIKLDIIPNRE